jgi:hypothetical protein
MSTWARLSYPAIITSCLFVAACDDPRAEDVRASYDQVFESFNSRDGRGAVALLTKASIDQMDRAVNMARKGTREQIKALPPIDRIEVIAIRNRLTAAELAEIDGRSWLILSTERGWETGEAPEIGRITFQGSSASAEVLEEGKRTGNHFDFDLIDGVWKLDWIRIDDLWNSQIVDFARESGTSVDKLILEWEYEECGIPVGDEIWDRVR